MKTKSAATDSKIKQIAKKQYKLTASEANVLAVWMEDAVNFSSVPSKLAEKLGRDISNVRKDLKSLATKGVLSPIPKQGKYQLYQLSKEILALAGDTEVITKSSAKAPTTNTSATPPVYSPTAVLSPISNYGQLDAATLQILNEVSHQKTLQFTLTATQKKDLESFNEKVTQFQEVKDFPLPYCLGGDASDLEMNILNKVMEVSAVDIEWNNGRPNSLNALVRHAMEKICDNTQSYGRYFFRDGKMPDKNPPVLFAFQLQNNHQLISFVSSVLQKHFQPTVEKYAEGWHKKIYAEVAEFAAMPAFPAHKHPDVVDKENEKNDLAFLKQAIKESENSFFEYQAFTILKYKHRANLLTEKESESFNDLLPKAEKFMAIRQAELSKPYVMSAEAEAAYNLLYGTK